MSSKIGIIQVDGKLPNLALMKISGYFENIGKEVEWYKGQMFDHEYENIYASKIFAFSHMPYYPKDKTIIGGTGIDFFNRMPEEFENATPTYSLYPKCDYHIGFSMKGCRFACKFCCVPKKEGRPYNYNTIDEIMINPKGKNKLMLLDNDFFGGTNWEGNLNRMIDLKLKVSFSQGLNIRIITQDQCNLLAKVKYYNPGFNMPLLTFAWDKYNDEKLIMNGIERCVNAGIKTRHMQFFVLIGFDTTKEQDLHRIYTLKKLGAYPYAMPHNRSDSYQKDLCNYVNGFKRTMFLNYTFDEYLEIKSRKGKYIKPNESQIDLF